MEYTLCNSCTVVAVNGDTSHLDPTEEATVSSWLESVGLIAQGESSDPGGYWECNSCGSVEIGEVIHFESI